MLKQTSMLNSFVSHPHQHNIFPHQSTIHTSLLSHHLSAGNKDLFTTTNNNNNAEALFERDLSSSASSMISTSALSPAISTTGTLEFNAAENHKQGIKRARSDTNRSDLSSDSNSTHASTALLTIKRECQELPARDV
jgi:hypothetical protein